jgi:phosphate:Na+ symporter
MIIMVNTLLLIFFAFSTVMKAQDPLGNDISGDNQVGTVETKLSKPIVVRVVDSSGKGESGIPVVFTILEEPKENIISNNFARISRDIVKTDINGYAMTELIFGKEPGNYYMLAEAEGESLIYKEIALKKNWIVLFIFSLFGGLGLFIFGLNYGSKGLIRAAGAKMRDFLFSLTRNRFIAVLVGIVVTVVFGSSTASSILLVKFASSGIIMLEQALAVLMGINVGTTITVQILAFKVLDYAILIVGIGFFLMHLFPKLRNIGQAIFGLGLLFFSLRIMSIATGNLKYLPNFNQLIASLAQYPIIGIVIAGLIAFLLRSSAATIGIVLILAFDSLIEFRQAVPLILGANLGTTISALISANNIEGRRVAFGHLLFNTVAIVIIVPFIKYVPVIMSAIGGDIPRQIANLHTLFNMFTALIFLPFVYPFAKLLKSLVRETKKELLRMHHLDPAFLSAPAIALGQAAREIQSMADITIKMLEDTMHVFKNRDNVLRKNIIETDDEVDALEETITPYLIKISEGEMNSRQSNFHRALMNAVNEIENIGDVISKKLMVYAKKQIDTGFVFSQEGFSQIEKMHGFALATFRTAIDALAMRDKNLATEGVAQRDRGYELAQQLNELHLDRLRRGLKKSLETSTIHMDIISDLERINFHATVIAAGLL